MKSLIDNAVNLGGNQEIGGKKTFLGTGDGGIELRGTDGSSAGYIDFNKSMDTDYFSRLLCKASNGYIMYTRGNVNFGEIFARLESNYSSNGYVKFGDGLQICWGSVTSGSTASFSHAFSSVWAATLTMVINENAGYSAYIGTLSTTAIKALRYNNNTSTSCRYIAIGKGA